MGTRTNNKENNGMSFFSKKLYSDNTCSAKWQALKITSIYFILGCTWILSSDKFVELTVQDHDSIFFINIIKGWIYVSVTSILIFMLIYYSMQRVISTKDKIEKMNHELEEKIQERTRQNALFISMMEDLKEKERLLVESQTIALIGSYQIDLKTKTWKGSPQIHNILKIDASYPNSLEKLADFIHQDSLMDFLAYHNEVVLGNKRFDHECKIRLHDGTENRDNTRYY